MFLRKSLLATYFFLALAACIQQSLAEEELLLTYNHEFAVTRIDVPSMPARVAVVDNGIVLTSSLQDTADLSLVDVRVGTVRPLGVLPLEQPWPRVLDIIVLRVDGPSGALTTARVLVSAAVDDHKAQCQLVVARTFEIDLTGGGKHWQVEEWFRSVCVPFSVGNNTQWESGGGLALAPGSSADNPHFYIGLGHFGAVDSDWYRKLPASDSDTIGTVLHITSAGGIEVVSRGHRNVQGLALVPNYKPPILLGTEHGPQGGDELNNILPSKDYGWPRVSMGQRYGGASEPTLPEVEEMHIGAEPPIFYFTPSVGLAPILLVSGAVFRGGWLRPEESGLTTLLVGGMANLTVIKLVFDGSRVVSQESIEIGLRVRSIVETDNKLVFGTDSGVLLVLTPTKTLLHGKMTPST